MATAQRASGTPTPGRSARVGRKRDGIPWDSPLTQVVKGALYRVFGWLELPAGYRYTTRQWVKPQLGVGGLVAPAVLVLGPVIDQEQEPGGGQALDQALEQGLRL